METTTQGKIDFLEHAADCAARAGWGDVALKLQMEAEDVRFDADMAEALEVNHA